ncbi:bifunctional protein FolC family protein [Candida parapsilosis]|uniref:Bifunctional protein FolC family protein n=1 Tax=Candida parapsilosis TaxID=5480 RepID=A0A8X7NJD4_CANPA|nr:bifunctional protein FolC family protein [Candida parapsilosis]KAF6046265.1 bifunctional protein FolC family protein [Candida parapsilosis]KAF6051294.1 bifunctional protein FolC family protein [Candida parapsilosis]KAF6061983.1 bifunctional protein FolC family protein [Candida parapsilosis]
MPIDLGLSRVTRLLSHFNNPHLKYKSIHVAGTNGKGSTLAYISSILTQHRLCNGKFTSPHMVELNDCITINNKTYSKSKFDVINQSVLQVDKELQLRCTEFEILTVTAFKIFELEKVELALIEVGVGGRLDATNVLEAFNGEGGVVATGITKIGMDHEGLLGNTIEQIAQEKAGILKTGIPCFADGRNSEEVLGVINDKAKALHCEVEVVEPTLEDKEVIQFSPLKGEYQLGNLALALRILESLRKYFTFSRDQIIAGIKSSYWPGRLESLQISGLREVLIDGAHNEDAAVELGKYIKATFPNKKITFVVGITRGKNLANLLKHIVRRGDTVIPTLFHQPDQMPWIKCESVEKITDVAKTFCQVKTVSKGAYLSDVFRNLKEGGNETSPIVVCGSLYLYADAVK